MPINLGKLPRVPVVEPKKPEQNFKVDYTVSSGILMTFLLFVIMVVMVVMSLKVKYEIADLKNEIRRSKFVDTAVYYDLTKGKDNGRDAGPTP